jgi:hypothetical protein
MSIKEASKDRLDSKDVAVAKGEVSLQEIGRAPAFGPWPESSMSGQGENWNRNDGELKVSCEARYARTALENASPRVEWLRMGRLALRSLHLQGYKHSPFG